jgi:hypothetical protein
MHGFMLNSSVRMTKAGCHRFLIKAVKSQWFLDYGLLTLDFLHKSKALTLNPSPIVRGTLKFSPLLPILGEGVGG